MEPTSLHPARRAFRWTVFAAMSASAILSAATIITLAIVNVRCSHLHHPSEPYIFMAIMYVMPWVAAAALQKLTIGRPGFSLDIWRAATLSAVYFNMTMISGPFLESFGPATIAECSVDTYWAMQQDLYQHDSLKHIIPPVLLLLTLPAAFALGGCLKAISLAADYVSGKATPSKELADP